MARGSTHSGSASLAYALHPVTGARDCLNPRAAFTLSREVNMQRMKQLATGAFSMMLASAGIAYAGDQEHETASDQGGRDAEPAPHTGSGAPNGPNMNRSSSSGQGSSTATSGMNRAQIQQVQRELQSRGLYSGAIDGMAGPQTMAAVEQFQAQQGLPASGSLDEATRRALGVQLDKQTVAGSQTSAGP
jgi:hypothetical protein